MFDLVKNQVRLDKVINNGSPLNLTQLPLKVPVNKEFDVTIVSENSVCVVYINDEIAFTNRIYKMNQNPHDVNLISRSEGIVVKKVNQPSVE